MALARAAAATNRHPSSRSGTGRTSSVSKSMHRAVSAAPRARRAGRAGPSGRRPSCARRGRTARRASSGRLVPRPLDRRRARSVRAPARPPARPTRRGLRPARGCRRSRGWTPTSGKPGSLELGDDSPHERPPTLAGGNVAQRKNRSSSPGRRRSTSRSHAPLPAPAGRACARTVTPLGDREGKGEAEVVVGVLADQVDAARGKRGARSDGTGDRLARPRRTPRGACL